MLAKPNFRIYPTYRTPINDLPVEIVERKGLGHPDSICDGAVDNIAKYLTRYYYEHFGQPLHFNVDKAVLVGGRSAPNFGGGEVLEPIIIHIVGRATVEVRTREGIEEPVPIGSLVLRGIRDYINENFRYLNPYEHVVIEYDIRPGSADLVSLYDRTKEEGIPLSNDTSLGVGYAPLSETEMVCLKIENYLNSREIKEKYPAVGEDIKVMCVRKEKKIHITLAMATVSRHVKNIDDYLNLKEDIHEVVTEIASRELKEMELGELQINTADKINDGSVYITVTGTSAESGDDGQVGRGNRANGLITPMRPMTIEAAAGKNAYNHVGKIYQIAANRIAERAYKEIGELKEVYVMLVSTIGKPITEPQIVNVEYLLNNPNIGHGNIESDISGIVDDVLNYLPKLWRDFMEGKIVVF